MHGLHKCLLLPVDGSEDSLRPIDFLSRLFPAKDQISVIVCYLSPPIPPLYREKPDSRDLMRRRQEVLRLRELETRKALDAAREKLLKSGFPAQALLEHVLERQSNTAKDACFIADVKKVDAVVLQKRITSSLKDLFKDDLTESVLDHCLLCPVWLMEGNARADHAVICIDREDASLRATDHAAFMLAGTPARITVLHVGRQVSSAITSPITHTNTDMDRWLATPEGLELKPFLTQVATILKKEGIRDEQVQVSVIPGQSKTAAQILSFCRSQDAGIVVIGHSRPTGIWDFLKGSVTRKIISELKDMTLWVNQ